MDGLGIAPGMAALGQQFIRRDRTPTADRIKLLRRQWRTRPAGADGIDDAPGGFHFVAPDEKGRVPANCFEQEPLVSLGRVGAEFGIIAEVHSHRSQPHAGARNFPVEAKRNSFVWLQSQGDGIGVEFRPALRREQNIRRRPELDPDFAGAERKIFSGAQVERHARPAPIIDE